MQTRKQFSRCALSDGIIPMQGANVSGRVRCFRPSIELKEKNTYVGNVPISPLDIPFSSVHGSTHYLQMTKLQYVNSSTTIELKKKHDNQICKLIATEIPAQGNHSSM